MDIFVANLTKHAMNYAIRSGLTITTGYAIRECSRLLKTVQGTARDQIAVLQRRLDSKIRIISPAIDMIELIAARGNTSLDSAVSLTKAIRLDIQALGARLSAAATDEEDLRRGSSKAKTPAQAEAQLQSIIADIKALLERIEDAVPLINLAITTSGVSLSTALPSTVSPSRLLQASTFLTAGDSAYAASPGRPVQVGPAFTLSVYMLFTGHSSRPHDDEEIRETTWKEVTHKTRVKLVRVPLESFVCTSQGAANQKLPYATAGSAKSAPSNVPSEGKAYEFAYQLLLVEDLEDDRVHTFEEGEDQPGPFQDVALAGIREVIPIHQISKIFYADTGKILNIGADGENNNPILLLKRDLEAIPPRRMVADDDEQHQVDEAWSEGKQGEDEDDDEADRQLRRESSFGMGAPAADASHASTGQTKVPWRFPPDLDPEWIAFEVYNEVPESDEDEYEGEPLKDAATSPNNDLDTSLAKLQLRDDNSTDSPQSSPFHPIDENGIAFPHESTSLAPSHQPPTALPPLRTSLSLLELLIRLTALQQFQQASHLTITDELLNFFLSESSTTGAGADSDYRRKVRRDARQRVGFDPYDESPIKLHGEDYQRGFGRSESRGSLYDDGFNNTPQFSSDRRSPGPLSPSPLLRRVAQERGPQTRATAATGSPRAATTMRGNSSPSAMAKGRREQLMKGHQVHPGSPLGRTRPDSALGTSPGSADKEANP